MSKKYKVTHFIDLLTDEEILALYKHFSGVTQVKFRDRETAEQRLINVSFGKIAAKMMEAFKTVGIHPDTARQYRDMLRGPIAMPDGPATPQDQKAHAKALLSGRKAERAEAIVASARQPGAAAAEVLKALRGYIPPEVTGEDANISSTDLAQRLGTNINAICKAADQLAKLKLVKIEDDSNPQHQFYWITLLPAGRELELIDPSTQSSSEPKRKLPSASPGPRPGYSGMRIFRLVTGNPRREGTHGWHSFNLIRDGMTYEEYRQAGGRNNDLAWDLDKKFVELREGGDNAKATQAAAPKEEGAAKIQAKASQQKASAGAVPDDAERALPKGQAKPRSKSGVASRAKKVLRKRMPVRQPNRKTSSARK